MTGYQVLVDQTAAKMTMIATMVLFLKMFAAIQMVGGVCGIASGVQ
jgi:hypothetical protein